MAVFTLRSIIVLCVYFNSINFYCSKSIQRPRVSLILLFRPSDSNRQRRSNGSSSTDLVDCSSPRSKRLRSSQDLATQLDDSTSRMYQSQPAPTVAVLESEPKNIEHMIEARNGFCFSQPALLDNLILCTQLNNTQGATSQNVFQKLVRRMTRFFVSCKCDETVKRLSAALEKLGYTWKMNDELVVS